MTRPATESGRSSQVALCMPPYPSTLSLTQPAASTAVFLILKEGESPWEAVIRQPPTAWAGIRQAMTALWLRVM